MRAGSRRRAVARVADQRGVEVLALPAGFSYVTFGHIGLDHVRRLPTPLALDGMGAFAGAPQAPASGWCATARTATTRAGRAGSWATARKPTTRPPSAARRRSCTTRPSASWSQDFVSLNGTSTNCAGGISYRREYWLTGEETVGGPDHRPGLQFAKRHGYLFQTPVDRGPNELELGVPITAAGRFSHEAAAVDQSTGIVYETEDPGSGVGAGFYRYTPDDPDDLTAGGELHMLAIAGQPKVDLREGRTRGQALPVTWVPIDEPDPDVDERL